MDVSGILTGGGTAGLIVAVAYVGKIIIDWRKGRPAPGAKATAAVADASATNAILLGSLREEREEVQRLSAEVAELRTQNASLYQQMREQRRDYEAEVAGLRKQLQELTSKVEAFQQRLRTDPPTA
ncbi:MAG TPA: hypothetical protein VFJ19_17070 [Nocardioidaceae bacterium]|nr:hypothetical protein [Nocardioidaceae bacterium]